MEIGGNSGLESQLSAHPLRHALVLDHDDLRLERIGCRFFENGCQLLKKIFQTIGLMKPHDQLLLTGKGLVLSLRGAGKVNNPKGNNHKDCNPILRQKEIFVSGTLTRP